MDINVLHAVLIAMIPVVIAIILSWAYNVVHGAISYLVMTFLLVFSLEAFEATLPTGLAEALVNGEVKKVSTCRPSKPEAREKIKQLDKGWYDDHAVFFKDGRKKYWLVKYEYHH